MTLHRQTEIPKSFYNNNMERKYTIYKLTSPSGKSYIGQTGQKPEIRWAKGNGYNTSSNIYKAIKKYKWENFTHEILEEGLTLKQANQVEKEYIKKFNTLAPNGYNLQPGGDNRKTHKETKKKLSKAHEKYDTPEWRAKISKTLKNYLWSMTPEERKKNRGRAQTQEIRIIKSEKSKKMWENRSELEKKEVGSKISYAKNHLSEEDQRRRSENIRKSRLAYIASHPNYTEEHSKSVKDVWASYTPEQRAARIQKAKEAKARKALNGK